MSWTFNVEEGATDLIIEAGDTFDDLNLVTIAYDTSRISTNTITLRRRFTPPDFDPNDIIFYPFHPQSFMTLRK